MSAILSVDDLNDFITPGVACIKPVETLPTAPPTPPPSTGGNEHEVFREDGPTASAAPGDPAQISLTDCLACSGCVTSAEAVLVSLQSHAEVLRALDEAPAVDIASLVSYSVSPPSSSSSSSSSSSLIYVASVSPQARASLAAACGPGTSEQEAGHMLEHLLAGPAGLRSGGAFGNGFSWVVDTNAAREATLVLGSDELMSMSSSSAASSPSSQPRPLLTASCPGWVCYAEKTHPHVLPYLSRVKSPQALTGTLLKTTLSRTLGVPADRIWHVAVMPCFDKKLEASRAELTDGAWADKGNGTSSSGGVRDVDCVITSKEVLMLAASRGLDFFSLPKTPLPPPHQRLPFPDPVIERFLFPPHRRHRPPRVAGSSGGNLYFILQSILAQHPGATLHTARGRNIDVVEYTIMAPSDNSDNATAADAKPLFKAARFYGFRNIQNLVRRLRPARPSRLPGGRPVGSTAAARRQAAATGLDYAYVEVMACPGGCTNGGGQIKVDDPIVVERLPPAGGVTAPIGPLEQKAWLAQVDEAYFSADEDSMDDGSEDVDLCSSPAKQTATPTIDGICPSDVRDVLAHWARITDIELPKLVHTTYREVVSDVGKAPATSGKKETAGVDHVVQLASKIGGGW